MSLAFPGASFLLTWSLAGGALGLGAAAFVRQAGERPAGGRPAAALIALAGAVPGIALMSSATYLLLMSAGLKQSVTVMAVWLVAGLLMLPLALVLRAFRFWLPGALAVAGVVVLFAVGSTVAFDSEHPQFTSVYYRAAPDGAAVWQSVDRVDDYTRPFLGRAPSSPDAAGVLPAARGRGRRARRRLRPTVCPGR